MRNTPYQNLIVDAHQTLTGFVGSICDIWEDVDFHSNDRVAVFNLIDSHYLAAKQIARLLAEALEYNDYSLPGLFPCDRRETEAEILKETLEKMITFFESAIRRADEIAFFDEPLEFINKLPFIIQFTKLKTKEIGKKSNFLPRKSLSKIPFSSWSDLKEKAEEALVESLRSPGLSLIPFWIPSIGVLWKNKNNQNFLVVGSLKGLSEDGLQLLDLVVSRKMRQGDEDPLLIALTKNQWEKEFQGYLPQVQR